MFRSPKVSPEVRRARTLEHNRLEQRAVLKGALGALSTHATPAIVDGHLPYGRHPYEDIAITLSSHFLTSLKSDQRRHLTPEETQNGFSTALRILGYAPRAYVRYCAQQKQKIDMDEMVTALKKSHHTPNLFAGMPGSDGMVYETAFGVYNRPDLNAKIDNPFVFGRGEDDSLRFVAEPDILEQVSSHPALRKNRGQPGLGPLRTCPAVGAFINEVWRNAIDICAADPGLFQQSLAEEARAYAEAAVDTN